MKIINAKHNLKTGLFQSKMKVLLLKFLKKSMKKIILFLMHVLLIGFCQPDPVLAQENEDSFEFNPKGNRVYIKLTNGAELGTGLLWKVTEDSLEFANTDIKKLKIPIRGLEILKLHFSQIQEIKTSSPQAVNKGILIGALVGLASGTALGIATTPNPEPYMSQQYVPGFCFILCFSGSVVEVPVDEPRNAGEVIVKALVVTALGAVVGAVLGSSSNIKETTGGSKEKFMALVPKLKKKAYWTQVNLPEGGKSQTVSK